MQPRVLGAPLVSVKVIQAKLLVFHAALGTSMMFLVLLLVNSVATTLISARKEEIRRASIAQRVGHLRSAVLNAKPVVRERMVQGVNSALWVSTEEQKIQPMYAWTAHPGITAMKKVNRFAWGATPVNLLQRIERLNVPSANLDGMKMKNDLQAHVKCAQMVFNQTLNVLPA